MVIGTKFDFELFIGVRFDFIPSNNHKLMFCGWLISFVTSANSKTLCLCILLVVVVEEAAVSSDFGFCVSVLS